MKKYFVIPVAFLILLSGMHITIDTHYCGGKVAASRISFTNEKATCGMESDNESNASPVTNFSSDCCKDEVSVYSFENTYTPSAFHLKEITRNILLVISIPESLITDLHYSYRIHTNIGPPGNYLASTVSMANICVFRI